MFTANMNIFDEICHKNNVLDKEWDKKSSNDGGSNSCLFNAQKNDASNNKTLQGVAQGHAIAETIGPACAMNSKFWIKANVRLWTQGPSESTPRSLFH